MTFRLVSAFLSVILGMTLASAAQAAWYEASSDHFVIYADDSEKDIREFSRNLERYHSALEAVTGRKVAKPSPSNRVTIFVVGNSREVRRLAGRSNVAGFYIPRAGGSRAFVQDIRNKDGYPHFSTVVLLHEYAHHFLISSNRFALPRWLNEGMAEFFAATSFEKDGGVILGRVARHRAYELASTNPPTARELLDPEEFRRNRGPRDEGFYGRSWLLYHYLTFNETRRQQLDTYGRAIVDGTPLPEAAEQAFGDLEALETELKAYRRNGDGGRFSAFELTAEELPIGDVSLRKLPKGEAAMMELRMVSQRGVTRKQAEELLPDVRKIAAKYPNDAGVLSALAEAEYDAGNDDAAIAAADKAIAIDPARTNPYVQKGYALFRKASDGDDAEAAYNDAMAPFSALNAQENDHPLPLIYYYRSFAERGEVPPENARKALERAAELAPFDQQLWLRVAVMQAQEGKIELAKFSLQPLAANPHGGRSASLAGDFIDVLDKIPEGTKFNLRSRPVVEIKIDEEQEPSDSESADPDQPETKEDAPA